MTNFAVDLASLGITFLFLIISFVAGLAIGIAGAVIGGAGQLMFGVVEAIAGGTSFHVRTEGSALAVFIRGIFWSLPASSPSTWLRSVWRSGARCSPSSPLSASALR